MISPEKESELRRNYDAFLAQLPALLEDRAGAYALMRHGAILGYFASAREAVTAGRRQFPDDLFSVQEVTSAKADFGWYSRAPAGEPL